jgi:sodium/hydrogen antiporter
VFTILVLQEAQLAHSDTILLAAYVTVGLAVLLLHGLSAVPLAQRYARWYETHPARPHGERSAAPRPGCSRRDLRGW